jgi:hypothetical protein
MPVILVLWRLGQKDHSLGYKTLSQKPNQKKKPPNFKNLKLSSPFILDQLPAF